MSQGYNVDKSKLALNSLTLNPKQLIYRPAIELFSWAKRKKKKKLNET